MCESTITTRATLLPCRHAFDYECVKPWVDIEKKCFTCHKPCTGILHHMVSDFQFEYDVIQPQDHELEEADEAEVSGNSSIEVYNREEDTDLDYDISPIRSLSSTFSFSFISRNDDEDSETQLLSPRSTMSNNDDEDISESQILFPRSIMSNNETESECSICLKGITARAVLEPCHHEFDYECITLWCADHDTCPNCRQQATRVLHNIESEYQFEYDIIRLRRYTMWGSDTSIFTTYHDGDSSSTTTDSSDDSSSSSDYIRSVYRPHVFSTRNM